ncbi:Panacea domain-containing protein [Actinotignum sp. GS-2025b]|uniref:Panacea domain-containing protein n=1 Tax=Actinotignum sp. GS-2025b TaxID=3427275 RepID=UPI003F46E7C9
MAKVEDVAAQILERCGRMTTMKLQKLTFYCQAAYLAETGSPIFEEDFRAWVNGPVSPELFSKHRGKFFIYPGELTSEAGTLSADALAVIDGVCDELGDLTANALVEKTHGEQPWLDARQGCDPQSHSQEIISKESIKAYYRTHPVVESLLV